MFSAGGPRPVGATDMFVPYKKTATKGKKADGTKKMGGGMHAVLAAHIQKRKSGKKTKK